MVSILCRYSISFVCFLGGIEYLHCKNTEVLFVGHTLFIVLFRNVVSSISMGPVFFYLCSRNCCCHSLRNAQETQIWEVSINTLLVHESLSSRNFVDMFMSLPGDSSIAEV